MRKPTKKQIAEVRALLRHVASEAHRLAEELDPKREGSGDSADDMVLTVLQGLYTKASYGLRAVPILQDPAPRPAKPAKPTGGAT